MVKEDRITSQPVRLAEAFRDIMANFAAGVTVVTSYSEGRHHGLTVSAFTSVSLVPPLVLICIDHASHSIHALKAAKGFTVNLLREGTADLAIRFASKDPDKFRGLAIQAPEYEGAGRLLPSHSFAGLECRTVETAEAGDHTVFIGQVENAFIYQPITPPLLYWQRDFRRLSTD